MALPPTLPLSMTRSRARVESAKQDVPDAPDLACGADRPGPESAAETIKEQRERAQREFKLVWTLCAVAH